MFAYFSCGFVGINFSWLNHLPEGKGVYKQSTYNTYV
jgi:hypothetical protein